MGAHFPGFRSGRSGEPGDAGHAEKEIACLIKGEKMFFLSFFFRMEGAPDFRDDVTPEEKTAVAEVRKLLKRNLGKWSSDGFVARFVRARGGDVAKAAKMLDECLEWREQEKVDTILEWWPNQEAAKRFNAYYPFENSDVYGLARDG